MNCQKTIKPAYWYFLPVILLLAWQVADASEPKTGDDCYQKGVLDRQCLSAHQQRTDSAVRDYYQSLQKSFEQSIQYGRDNPSDPDDPGGNEWFEQRLEMLLKSQTLWLEYRDTVCQVHAHEYQHGSLAWPVKMTCLIEFNEARLQQLQNIYNPETE
ncbi:MAG: DUF1311 domain-containing protein [Gammaproteobacteria bacterium]|nr:DUF1311 domain-containing protein [Gammaproteobacteria bacterium]